MDKAEVNVVESVYTRIVDPKIALAEKGKAQAEECGKIILNREIIETGEAYCGKRFSTGETRRVEGRWANGESDGADGLRLPIVILYSWFKFG
jgi:hypothetical protein